MNLAARKRIELEHKLASFDAELTFWESATAANQALQKHRSQVERWAKNLRLRRQKLLLPASDAALLAGSAAILTDLLALYRVWGFFRRKLALRSVDRFRDALEAADELAWQCYRPAIELNLAPDRQFKEPPLVFLDDRIYPMTFARAKEARIGDAADFKLKDADLEATLKTLPFSFIGLPWANLEHLPDAVILAHEVGHCVEQDLALGPALDRDIAQQIDPARAAQWRAWRSETYADVFGARALGPAYALALSSLLAGETYTAREYASPSLRIALVCATLDREGHVAEAASIAQEWNQQFPPPSAAAEAALRGDAVAIADLMRATPFPAFTPADQRNAEADRDRVIAPLTSPSQSNDVRTLIAAATLAFFKDPAAYAAKNVREKILARVLAVRAPGTRALPAAADAAIAAQRVQHDLDQTELLFSFKPPAP